MFSLFECVDEDKGSSNPHNYRLAGLHKLGTVFLCFVKFKAILVISS